MAGFRRMILAGDVGGTNARLAIYDVERRKLKSLALEVVPTRLYESFQEVAAGFMERHATPVERACFGVPGPVKGGRAHPPNLAWEFDEERLADDLGLKKVHLVNDLVSNAYGIAALEEEDFAPLNAGEPIEGGNSALISPGTGLGEAGLLWLGDHHRPFPSEGGHTDLAPRDELEIGLLQFLLTHLEHVSYETILSGAGLHRIYQFLRETGRAEEPAWLAGRIQAEDPPAVISTVALEGGSELCVRALDLFRVDPWSGSREPGAQGVRDRECIHRRRHRAEDPSQAEGAGVHEILHRQGKAEAAGPLDTRPCHFERQNGPVGRGAICRAARRTA
jgi:glucokinase